MLNHIYSWEGNENDKSGFLVLFPDTNNECKIFFEEFSNAIKVADKILNMAYVHYEHGKRDGRSMLANQIQRVI